MTNAISYLVPLFLIFNIIYLPFPTLSVSCNGPCKTFNGCDGQLSCIKGKGNDDTAVGTHICSGGGGGGGGGGGSSPPSQTCKSSGTLKCGGKSFPQFRCSPPVTSSTQASLTLNDFSQGGDGGSPSECDNKFHDNSERVVALSTGWYDNGSGCGKMIRITARNGRNVTAKVVDECDSVNGCDSEHAGQPPCNNNIVDGSSSVWEALGLNQDLGVVGVTWSMAWLGMELGISGALALLLVLL